MGTYYKILPEDLICKGFQYQEGLNIDTNEIDEDEYSYGLHFVDVVDIFLFSGYGTMIAEVEIPEDAVVYHFAGQSKADRIILKNLRPLWSVDVIKKLIQEGAMFDPLKDEILRYAVSYGKLDVVKFLVKDQGADIYTYNDYVMRCAISNGYLDIVKYDISQRDNGFQMQEWEFSNLYPALMHASEKGYLDIIKYFAEQGFNIHDWKYDALFHASANDHADIVKYLAEHGADIHAHGDYAFAYATKYGHLNVMKCLVEHGVDIHSGDNNILFQASVHGYLEVVKYLVEQGADIHARDDCAIRYAGTPEVKAYLKSLP